MFTQGMTWVGITWAILSTLVVLVNGRNLLDMSPGYALGYYGAFYGPPVFFLWRGWRRARRKFASTR